MYIKKNRKQRIKPCKQSHNNGRGTKKSDLPYSRTTSYHEDSEDDPNLLPDLFIFLAECSFSSHHKKMVVSIREWQQKESEGIFHGKEVAPEDIVEEAVITTMKTTQGVDTTTIIINLAKKRHQQSGSTVISQVTKRSTPKTNIMKRDQKQEKTVFSTEPVSWKVIWLCIVLHLSHGTATISLACHFWGHTSHDGAKICIHDLP